MATHIIDKITDLLGNVFKFKDNSGDASSHTHEISNVNGLQSALNGKADKVSGATNGHFAGLNASGNLIDSEKKASDFATAAQGAKADTAYGWGNHANAGYAKTDGSNASGDWAISATKGRLVSRTDFDALVTTGTYEIVIENEEELINSNHPPTEGTAAGTCRGFIEVRNVGGATNTIIQKATYNVGYIVTRRRQNNNWTSWERMTYIPNGSAVGSTTQPVYVDVNGAVQPCSGNDTLFIELIGGNRTLTDNELKLYDSVYSSSSDTTTRFINIDATLMVDKKKYFVLLGNNVNLRLKASNLYDAYYHSAKLTLSTSYQEIPSYGFGYRFFTMFKSGYNVYLLGY